MKKSEDPRYHRTHKLLQDSLMSLINEKYYYKITINDITERAGVNRGTFYFHYPDILALLNDCLLAGITFDEPLPSKFDITIDPEKSINRTKKYLGFCFAHPDLMIMVFNEFQTNPYLSTFYEANINSQCSVQKALCPDDSVHLCPNKQIARYVVAGQARFLCDWLVTKPSDPLEYLAKYFHVVLIKASCGLLGVDVPEWVNPMYSSLRRNNF